MNRDTDVTPGRTTRVYYDVPDYILQEPGWSHARHMMQIDVNLESPYLRDFDRAGLFQWPSGFWSMRPLQAELSYYQDGWDEGDIRRTGSLLQSEDWNFPDGYIAERKGYGRAPMTDIDEISPNFPLLQKIVPSGSSWKAELPTVSDFAKPPVDGEDPDDHDIDRMLESKTVYVEDQGFFLHFWCPGTGGENPKVLMNFYFGQFALQLRGDGTAHLFRYLVLDGDPAAFASWSWVDAFRWSHPQRACGSPHNIIIWPYGPGKLIEFHCDVGEITRFIGHGRSNVDYANKQAAYSFTHVDPGYLEPFGHSTIANVVRIDMRREVRTLFHVSKLSYPDQIRLPELPIAVELSDDSTQIITIGARTNIPAHTSMEVDLVNAHDHTILSEVAPNQWVLPAGCRAVYPLWLFNSDDGKGTPALLSSYLNKEPLSALDDNTPFQGGLLRAVQIVGPTNDPSQEMGSLVVNDRYTELDALRQRDNIPVAIVEEFDDPLPIVLADNSDDVQDKVTIFRGYTKRSRSHEMPSVGRILSFEGMDADDLCQWFKQTTPLVGMWERLAEQPTIRLKDYGQDGNAPQDENGNYPPWKVTSVIRDLLTHCGFPDSMIVVPDIPLRLWGDGTTATSYTINPNTNVAQAALELARDYLGGWLVFDANYGFTSLSPTFGAWRLILPPQPPYITVAGFVKSSHGFALPPTQLCLYPENTAFVQTCDDYPIAPERNAIIMVGDTAETQLGAGKNIRTQWARNYKSWNVVPGSADKTSVDWRGRCIPLPIGDTTLIDQASCDWETRRYYDFVCRGRLMREGIAPYLFCYDLDFGHVRPLWYYDAVDMWDGKWLVRSCNPEFRGSDGVQMAHYELMKAPKPDCEDGVQP